MTQLTWNKAGERTFEAGVDRGVLYVDGKGVAWNGLVSVSENPSGGEVNSYYLDGLKYLDHIGNEDFEATIEAFTYPEEFAECDGTRSITNGLFITHQKKKSFGLAYRTKLGNDVGGIEHGYKIHIIYNAKAVPLELSYNTLTDSPEPSVFAWEIFTKPPSLIGYKPTSYFVINSREVPELLIEQIEFILYGSVESEPRLPSVGELIQIFKNYDALFIDAGRLHHKYFVTVDAGHISEEQTSTIDGGGP